MIDPEIYGLVEMGFTGAVVLGFAFWQLWTVRDAGKKKPEPLPDEDSPKPSGHSEG